LTVRRSATASATDFQNWADTSDTAFVMSLPETIAIRFTEEDAGYVTVRPVVRQTFRMAELTDMVLTVTGKNVARVQQIFRAGTVVYNGYRYWWDSFAAEPSEISALLEPYPEDDPSLPFHASKVISVSLEIGGGSQRSLIEITQEEASAKRWLQKRRPWEILLGAAQKTAPRYEKYSHAHRADLYRLNLSIELAQALMAEMRAAAPRALQKKLAGVQPPAALLYFIPRTSSASTVMSA
jgi:hypothetical protein